MFRQIFSMSILLSALAFTLYGQGGPSCSCSIQGRCSVSQTCNSGWNAVCECSASGCTSSCVKIQEENDFTSTGFETALSSGDPKTIQRFLFRATGRNVEFVPTNPGARLSYPKALRGSSSLWDAFDFLAKNGRLRVSGQDFAHWVSVRDLLNRGEEYTVCSDQARFVLRHLEFLSGKRYSIVSGEPNTKLQGPITGNGVIGVIETLKRVANLDIVEN